MNKKSNLKIIAATSMSIFTLATVFVASFAWFTAARKVDADGNGFEVISYDGLIKSLSAHMFKELDSNKNYVFYETEDSSTTETEVVNYIVDQKTGQITSPTKDSISFGVYDTLMPADAYAVLFLIELDTNVAKTKNSITIKPSTTTTEANSLAHSENFNSSDNPMSSIVDFFYSSSTSADSKCTVTASNSKQNFLTFNSLTSTTYNQSLEGNTYSSFDDTCYIQVVCEYNISNIENIYSLNLDSDALSLNNEANISYKQDWKITIS